MDHFCNADATTTPVGSYQMHPWMFLYEAYAVRFTPHHVFSMPFVWAPVSGSTKFRCLGQRSLGCGWLLDVDSPRFVGSRRISRDRSSLFWTISKWREYIMFFTPRYAPFVIRRSAFLIVSTYLIELVHDEWRKVGNGNHVLSARLVGEWLAKSVL